MAFLPKFADRDGYVDANIYQFERRRPRERREPTSSVSFGPSPLQTNDYGNRGIFGPASRGVIDRMGSSGGNPTAGLLGIQNTTGFSQEAPNVVYDQGPEQFEKELKLKKRELDIREMQAQGILDNNAILNQTRMMNAGANQERAAVARMRAQNPNLVFQRIPGGNLVALDPATGEVMDTGISSGTMTQEGAINLRNQGQMNVQGLRNTGAMDQIGLRNQGMLDRIAAQGVENMSLEDLRQFGREVLQGRGLEATRQNTIFKEGSNTYRTRAKEGDPNAAPPEMPPWAGTIRPRPEPRQAPDMGLPSGLNLGGGNTLQLRPDQMQGFQAAPGQFEAKPGQFTPPAQGQTPPAGTNPQEAQLAKQAEEILAKQGKPVTPANIQYVMQQLATKQSSTTPGQLSAGTVAGQSAGTLSGPSAGTVSRR